MHPTDEILNAFADGDLPAAERADVERHVAGCAACRTAVDEFTAVRREAARLEPLEPPVRAWKAIRAEIDDGRHDANVGAPRSVTSGATRTTRMTGRRSMALAGLATAAALVVAVGIGVARWTRPTAATVSTTSATPSGSAVDVESELRLAEQHYEKAIAGLEQIANAGQGSLDPKTASTLQKNLAVIDQAISESRAAVRSQPSSEPAQESLLQNFRTKISVLQDTVALINEMRKGNEAGAAKIVSGLKQKGN